MSHLSLMSCLLTNEQRKTLSKDIDEKTTTNKPRLEISNNVVCATSKDSDQPAHTRSLIRAFATCSRSNILSVKLLTEHHLEFLSLKGGCTGSSESTLVKMPHCWKSHSMAKLSFPVFIHFFPSFFYLPLLTFF